MQKIKEGIIYFLTQEEGGRKSPPTDLIYYPTTIVDNKPWSIVIFFDESLQKEQYSNVMYYGKSDNLRPYNLDKDIKGQNYDFQSLYNNAMESVIIYSSNYEICHIGTRFGRMSMWASNLMHSTILFPNPPIITMMKPSRDEYKSEKDFNNAMRKYENMKKQYDIDFKNYMESILLNKKAHFHYLYVLYNDKNEIDEKRVKEYIDAPQMRDKLPIKMK